MRAVVAVHAALFLWASLQFGHAGAIRAANALRLDPAFRGDLVVVGDVGSDRGGDITSVGGAYYLRQQRLRVVGVERRGFGAYVERSRPPADTFVVAVRKPLAPDAPGPGARLRWVGTYHGLFDLREKDRRFVYRLER